ncbi:MAG: ABC transporter permease [Candidatus Aureabacteria bacterium]|nr:ABC transporter permease [Candidatus Auribacterota bacterium]
MSLWREVVTKRGLLGTLVSRNLKIRYQGSAIGFLWTLLNPLFMALIYWIFIRFMKFAMDPFSLLAGVLSWQFLTMCCGDAVNSVAGHPNLVKKVYFPRIILPLSTVLANLLNFLLSLLVLIALAIIAGRLAWGEALAALPAVVLLQTIFCLGLTLIISCSSVYFRDTEHIIQVLLMAWFFMSPVVYPMELLSRGGVMPAWLLGVYSLNPMVGLITSYRASILHGPAPEWIAAAASLLLAPLALVAGLRVFMRHEPDFADEL